MAEVVLLHVGRLSLLWVKFSHCLKKMALTQKAWRSGGRGFGRRGRKPCSSLPLNSASQTFPDLYFGLQLKVFCHNLCAIFGRGAQTYF